MAFNPQGPWAEYSQNGLPAAEARDNMGVILEHFVKCDWTGCCHGVFLKIIKPYLDDVDVVRAFLLSQCIREAGDTARGRAGELIFYDLFKYLMNVNSDAVHRYLRDTFPGFAARFDQNPFNL